MRKFDLVRVQLLVVMEFEEIGVIFYSSDKEIAGCNDELISNP
jgi:hypothetical protein